MLVFALLLALAAGAAGLAAGPAAAKDFSITSIDVRGAGDAQRRRAHHRHADARLQRRLPLRLLGPLESGADAIKILGASGPADGDPATTVPYELSRYAIVGMASGERQTYAVERERRRRHRAAQLRGHRRHGRFTVRYVAKGAAKKFTDTAQLYWQFIGADTAVESRNVAVTVHLPAGVTKDQVKAWAHGPLWGTVTIQPDASVVMKVDPLPAKTFVEGRILFPAAALTKAPQQPGAKLAEALAEEKQWADEANRTRWWARVKVVLWGVVGVGVPARGARAARWCSGSRFGREPKTQFQAQYLRDFPQPHLPPALAAFIWNMGSVGCDEVTATLLDLANRKVIDLERVAVREDGLFGDKEKVTYKLTLHDERLEELLDYERQLCKFLFHQMADGNELVLSELKEIAKTHRSLVRQGLPDLQEQGREGGRARGYLDAQADRMAFTASAFAFAAIVAAGAAAVFGGFWCSGRHPVGVVLIFVARAVKRRSPEAAELHAQYAALERYLKDFGRLDEKPPDAVVLWEKFLIYAVVFGIADQVTKAMTVKVPEVVNDPAFRTPYLLWWGMPGDRPVSRRSTNCTRASRRRSRWRRPRRRPARAAAAGSPAAAAAAAAAAASAPADLRRPPAHWRPARQVCTAAKCLPARAAGRNPAKRATSPGLRKAYGECARREPWHVPIPSRSVRSTGASRRPSRPHGAPSAITSTSPARWSSASVSSSARPAASRSPSRSGRCRRTWPSSAATRPSRRRAGCSPSTPPRRARLSAAGLTVDLAQFTRSQSRPDVYYTLFDHASRRQIHSALHRLVPALEPHTVAA